MEQYTNSGDFINATRYSELGYVKDSVNIWRIIDRSTGRRIGLLYTSKLELMTDLSRVAALFGCK